MTKKMILELLREADGFVSGESLSRKLKMSRAGIWKNIEELRKDGYCINAVPHSGYALTSVPDKLFASEVQTGLNTDVFGKTFHHFDSLPSTMDKAVQLAMDGESEGAVVCAESQTQGKGRQGRGWSSPKGKGIYMSMILRPQLAMTEIPKLTLLSAVVLCEAIREVCNVKASIKWPNDLLVGDQKVAGILTESSAQMDTVRYVVVGIGINVNASPAHLPAVATSLKQEAQHSVSRLALMREILRIFEKEYERAQREGFDEVLTCWKKMSSTLGEHIQISEPTGSVEGLAVDLDEYGGLIIKSNQGKIIKRMTGDVRHLSAGQANQLTGTKE